MSRKVLVTVTAVCVLITILSTSTWSRAALDAFGSKDSQGRFALQQPCYGVAMHRVGKLVLAVNNNGTFGTGFTQGSAVDYFTGQPIPAGGGEYPKGSGHQYLFAASFWIGAVIGRDTLVSTGADGWIGIREMFPEEAPFGCMVKRSIIDPTKPEFEGAISEEDYISVYLDTFVQLAGTDAEDGGRIHKPLGIEITDASYAWSYSYAEDLVLFDYKIKNIGTRTLDSVYMGIYVDADVCINCDQGTGFTDDICGFRETDVFPFSQCEYEDTVNIAWIADNDGDLGKLDPNTGQPAEVPAVTATRIVRTPGEQLDVSFNWWISNGTPSLDFGPRERSGVGRLKEDFRNFRTGGLGTPSRDDNKYYILRNKEFDYDQIYTAAIQPNDTLWLYPNQDLARDFSDGYDTRYLLSFGPFNISPGQTLPVSFAYLAGDNLHTIQENINNLTTNYNPDLFYANLDFSDLSTNSRWASWIYDNPGVDTDGDGDSGDFFVCVIDSNLSETLWTKGDGVPDFRGASPPPAPKMWLIPSEGQIRVRFNGFRSETTRDVFSRVADFEGYRVYLGRDERATSFSVIASYDKEDYNKFIYNPTRNTWELKDIPFTLDELREIYNDPTLDPLLYTRNSPYRPSNSDSLFYFEKQDFNVSDLSSPTGIHKIYPDQPYPSTLNIEDADPDELTDDGYFKYFEYEYIIPNLLPTVSYWVNVTAFDFGSPQSGLASLETSVSVGAQEAYPTTLAGDVEAQGLKVMVYPNPYRIDAGYRTLGFEGRGPDQIDRPDDRVRAINFTNLPPKCTIKIFTLDGDLVREIIHDKDPSDPTASHDTWDLVTRNTQLVVSGIYYWTVESETGETQIGKIVILM